MVRLGLLMGRSLNPSIFFSFIAGSSNRRTLSLSLTPTICRYSSSPLSLPLKRSLCSRGSKLVTNDRIIFNSPKVDVDSIEIWCECETVDTVIVINPSPELRLLSLF
ncbi:hypothetical protein V8G54_018008 [Vigna mungo]|uniref:Uncharacterized protein n=1 Tax=Vigna mungo TaxID=3915 RepID=A0AAQ3N838_VIGMU